jgi:DUF971 family protein
MNSPQQITNNRQQRVLNIIWDDGSTQQLPHATLRAQCKCTLCQSQRLLAGAGTDADADVPPPPAPAADIRIEEIHPVGAYGMQLIFSDGHERGIYPWPYLRALSAVSTPA